VPGPVIALYSPDIPPTPGGVADHTLAVARALDAEGHRPIVLAGRGDPGRFTPIPCSTGVTPLDAPFRARDGGARWLLLQYVPFLYAGRGVAPVLWTFGGVCRRAGVRLAVFVHEPFVPLTRLPWLVTGPLQRMQLRLLLRGADHVYSGVPRWVDLAKRYARPTTRVRLAPVGATLAPSSLDRAAARARLGLGDHRVAVGIFSPAAAGFRHDWIRTAVHALALRADITWVRFGFGSARAMDGYPEGPGVITVGESDPATIADTMRALDLLAAPYVDGLTMRRTGAMLGLASGVAVVSSRGHLFDPAMDQLAACEPDASAFAARLAALAADPASRAAVAARADGFEATASTAALARRLVADLEEAA